MYKRQVMFRCDCHPDGDRANGYWDPDCFQYGEVLGGLTFGMTKAERLLTRDSTMNQCMMFCGVNLDAVSYTHLYFSKSFNMKYHMSPSEFVKQNLQNKK